MREFMKPEIDFFPTVTVCMTSLFVDIGCNPLIRLDPSVRFMIIKYGPYCVELNRFFLTQSPIIEKIDSNENDDM